MVICSGRARLGSGSDPDIADLTINRFPVLAELTGALDDACRGVERGLTRTMLVIQSGGPNGCAPVPMPTTVAEVTRWERALRRTERLPGLTVIIADGPCRGPTFDLLLVADLRLVTRSLAAGLAFGADGALPGMALYRLVQQIGAAQARRLAMSDDPLDAERCHALGLADEIIDDFDAGHARLLMLRGRLCGADWPTRRRLLLEAATSSYDEALGAHLAAYHRALRIADGAQEPDP